MATLIAAADGNFTSSSTWGLVDSTSFLNSSVNNTTLTTSYVSSSNFTPGAITVDGIAVRVWFRNSSPSGTMSVELYNATGAASVAGTEVTKNISDIIVAAESGWHFFKFPAPVTLLAATNYNVRAKSSGAGQVGLLRDGTANNWSRALRTTTNQAPAAGDVLIIGAEWTAAATYTARTVTMDQTATTAYGDIYIGDYGTMSYATSASTNYYLRCGSIYGYAGGTLNVGTTGTPIPSTSTAILEFNSASGAQHGLNVNTNFTFVAQGNAKTNYRSLMTVDKVATNTVITVASTANWAAGDELVFPTTTRTRTECESKFISTVDSATQVTLTAGLTNAHSGTSPTQAEVANITRNVKIRGISSTNTGCIVIPNVLCTIDVDWVEFYWLGANTANRRGICVSAIPTGSSVSIRYSSIHSNTVTGSRGFQVSSGITVNGLLEFSDNVTYNNVNSHVDLPDMAGVQTFNNNYCILNSTGSTNIYNVVGRACASTHTNIKTVGGVSYGMYFGNGTTSAFGTCNNLTAHSCQQNIAFDGISSGTVTTVSTWMASGGAGVAFGVSSLSTSGSNIASTSTFIIDGLTCFGNSGANIDIGSLGTGVYSRTAPLIIKNAVLNAGATLTCPIGVNMISAGGGTVGEIQFIDCQFGVTTTHSTGDIVLTSGQGGNMQPIIYYNNCIFGSSTEFSNQTDLRYNEGYYGVHSFNHDQVSGAVKTWARLGTLTTDTSIFNTASPSVRLTPNNSSNRFASPTKKVPVNAGGTVTVSVSVRQSSAGDGTNYTGTACRLMLKANYALGILTDTVLDTYSVANGNWEVLTGTTATISQAGVLEFYVDCMSTAGWVNVDDFTTTATDDMTGAKYYLYGLIEFGNIAAGGGGGGTGGSFTFS